MSDKKEEITRRLVRVAFDPHHMKLLFTQAKEVHLKCVEGLPENAEWVGEYFDNQTCRVFFIFRHESFDPIPPHLMLPELRIVTEHCPTQRVPDAVYCTGCSGNDIEPDYIEFLNDEVKWHENNIVQDENKERQAAFINGIRHAIFLIVKAKRELTSRAADAANAAPIECIENIE